MMGRPFVENRDILAEIALPGFGKTRILKVFKLFEIQELALHSCFVRDLVLGLDKLESACREHGVRFMSAGLVGPVDVLVDAEGGGALGLTPPAIGGIGGPFDVEGPSQP